MQKVIAKKATVAVATADSEIDTALQPEGKGIGDFPAELLPFTEISISLKTDNDQPNKATEKTFYFGDFSNIGYGELVRISLRLVQTGEGIGLAYLTFTQQMRCRRSDVVEGADLSFMFRCFDSHNAYIRDIHCGTWNRRCGVHLVELKEYFTWVVGSINPVENAARGVLTCTYKQRVHNCP